MPKVVPSALLSDVIELIALDIENIKRSIRRGKLSHDTALDLTRYSKALLDIVQELKDVKEDEAKRLKGLSDDELLAKAQEAIDKMKTGNTNNIE